MGTSFNAHPGVAFSSPAAGALSADHDAEKWLNDLVHLTETLSCALTPSLDESTLSKAVANVEKTVSNLHSWVQRDTNNELKKKVASGVSAALNSICCDLKPAIERAPQANLSMIVQVLDVGDRLLQCHKLIKDQMIQALV
jgi:hypothetical protein